MLDTDDDGRIIAMTVGFSPTVTPTPPPAQAVGIRRRRRPAQLEQARREAWGRQWGAVGAEYKRLREQREGR